MARVAGEGIAAFFSRDDAGERSGTPGLHQRHHRPAQRRAHAASMPARQPAGLCLLARRLSTPRRSVLVAGGLGLDGRVDGCALANALFRASHPRLSRPIRSGTRVGTDRKVPGAKRVPLSDGAEDDNEGRCRTPKALRHSLTHHDERRRSGRNDGIRVGAGIAWCHHKRNVRSDRDELHRWQLSHTVGGETWLDGPALPGSSHYGDR